MRHLTAALLAIWLALPAVAQTDTQTGPETGDVAGAATSETTATDPSAGDPTTADDPAAVDAPAAEPVVDPEWQVVATRADQVLKNPGTSVRALEALRAELVRWRARFQEAEGTNAPRIAALQAQLEALGPVPAEGETEPPGIAAQRAEITARIDALGAPAIEAKAAYGTADGLIAETDRLISQGREEELLTKSPSPLNPANWPVAMSAVGTWLAGLGRDLLSPFATPEARAVWQARGVELGGLVFLAIILLWRSGVWLGRLRERLARVEATSAVARVTLLAVSLARLVLPVLGLFAVTRILQLMGADGLRVDQMVTLLPIMGGVVLMARWLAYQSLPPRKLAAAFLPVSPARRREARWYIIALGGLFALGLVVETIAQASPGDAAIRAVPFFLLLVLAGLDMFRLGQIFLSEGTTAREDDSEGFWAQLMRLLGRALMAVAVAAPVVAAFGYVNLGNAILWPAVLTLALIALIGILQGFVFDLYAALTRRSDAGRDALAPTLVGFALAVSAAPVVALIWGVRFSTLGEWWTTFLRGFNVGDTTISPSSFMTFAVVFGAGFLIVKLVKGVLRTNVLPKTRLDTGGTNAILSGTSYVGVTLATLIAITAAGINLGGLAIVAGALSVGVGFGLQTIVQNFVSGIILLIERPIKLGDWVLVQASGVEGFVRQISVRSTRIETFDKQDVIVPNADLISGVVTNYTLSNSSGRVVLSVGVAYGTDTRRVEKILQEVAEAHPMVILNPPPLITFDGFGADSLNFTIRVVLRDILFKVIVGSELNHAIAERFREEGLEIPFAQRDIWLRNPEALRPSEAT